MSIELHEHIEKAAGALRLPYCKVWAHIEKEAAGEFRWSEGRIPCLLERHWVYDWLVKNRSKEIADEVSSRYPHLVNKIPGGYGKYSEQYGKIAELIKLGYSEAAHYGSSWSGFQFMGFHFKMFGFSSAVEFVKWLHEKPEANAIKAYVEFMQNYKNGDCLKALRENDIQTFARLYNGKNYKKNNYDKDYLKFVTRCRYKFDV